MAPVPEAQNGTKTVEKSSAFLVGLRTSAVLKHASPDAATCHVANSA